MAAATGTMTKPDTQAFNHHFEKLATNQQAAELLGVDEVTLWRWRRDGLISYLKIGSKIRYRFSEIDRILNNSERKAEVMTA